MCSLARTGYCGRFVCHRTFDRGPERAARRTQRRDAFGRRLERDPFRVAKELSMKHALTLVGVMFAAAALHAQEPSTFKFEVQARMPLENRIVKNAPYSAEVVTDHMQQLADGNRIVEHSSGRVYRDREGRVRREEDRQSGNPAISIFDPISGVSYSLDPERRIAWKSSAQVGLALMNKLDAAKMEASRIEELKR